MKWILVAAVLLLPSVNKYNTVDEINWRTIRQVNNITIYTQFEFPTFTVYQIYERSRYLFLNEFETKLACEPHEKLKIKIISTNILRNKKYFTNANSTNFGRYFKETNEIFIIDDMRYNNEFLAHEIAHYLYDTCGIEFKSEEEEHKKVYMFQTLYEKRFKNE